VEITSVVRGSDDSFTVRWSEKTFVNGSLAKTERYTGILSIVMQRPRTVQVLRKNPLGIYVHGLNWSRDLNPGESS
jgi:type IV secretion system protein VirB5